MTDLTDANVIGHAMPSPPLQGGEKMSILASGGGEILPLRRTANMVKVLRQLTVLLACGILLCGGTDSLAGTPKIDGIRPFGVQRGVATEVTINGSSLAGNPRLSAPFGSRSDAVDPKRSGDGSWTFKLSVSPDVAVGVYPVRVQTDNGLSNPFLFSVGQLPQVSEKEDNTSFEAAQALPATPLVVEGEAAGNDVDYFKFAGKKGQVIVVDAQCARIGSGMDPTIRLTTASASRRFVASADDSPGLLTDARLVAELPEDTDYVVEISDSKYQGSSRPVYRLLIGPVPVADEVFPLGGARARPLGSSFVEAHWARSASARPR